MRRRDSRPTRGIWNKVRTEGGNKSVCGNLAGAKGVVGNKQEKLAGITVTVRYCRRHWRIKIEADEKK
jgi:hypothetical protein